MRRLSSFLARLGLTFAIVLAALWGALALSFRLPGPEAVRWTIAAGFALMLLYGVVGLWRRRSRPVVIVPIALVALGLWWTAIPPSHQRNWIPELARLPTTRVEGERLTVENVRNFRWLSETQADQRWETRQFDLAALEGADIALSYWSGEAIAHLIVSFAFRDGPPLATSIEVRREVGEEWSSIAGFFKQYELAYVAADERDVIGLRTHRRGEDVRLYRLRATPSQARDVLMAYAADMNRLAASPRWYDTLTANCTTLAYRMARGFSGSWKVALPIDPRLLLSGYLPGYLQQVGALRSDLPLEALEARAHVSARARLIDLDDPGFSAKLREGLPEREP